MFADKNKILVIGAGVIGSLYAAKLAKSGCNVTVLARGERLSCIKENGLLIKSVRSSKPEKVAVSVVDALYPGDNYDFILVAVRAENLKELYPLLKNNCSPNIVFMVNNYSGSGEYINEIGRKRTVVAFPGAGGFIKNGIVHYHIISRFIQPTTIGDFSEDGSSRIKALKKIFCKAGLYVSINRDMNSWLINHLALVCPLANAIYFDGGNNHSVSKNEKALILLTEALKENFNFILKEPDLKINPHKLRFFIYCPDEILFFFLKWMYNTQWARTVINNHALKAREEMNLLSWGFLKSAFNRGKKLEYLERLVIFGKR